MASAPPLAAVSAEEYLSSSYHPDMEYIDGVLVERFLGERKHSRLQTMLAGLLLSKEQEVETVTYTEQRIRVGPGRYRVPDISVMPAEHTREDVFTEPPLLVIEILSQSDQFPELRRKINDYRAMGIRHVCIADPSSTPGVFLVDESGRLQESAFLTVNFDVRPGTVPLTIDFGAMFQLA